MNHGLKSEVKLNTINECGIRLDDNLEKLKDRTKELKGRMLGGQEISLNVKQTMTSRIQKEIDTGKIDLELGKIKIELIEESFKFSFDLVKRYEDAHKAMSGQLDGMSMAIGVVKKMLEEETKNTEILLRRLEANKNNPGKVDENGRPKPIKEIMQARSENQSEGVEQEKKEELTDEQLLEIAKQAAIESTSAINKAMEDVKKENEQEKAQEQQKEESEVIEVIDAIDAIDVTETPEVKEEPEQEPSSFKKKKRN